MGTRVNITKNGEFRNIDYKHNSTWLMLSTYISSGFSSDSETFSKSFIGTACIVMYVTGSFPCNGENLFGAFDFES